MKPSELRYAAMPHISDDVVELYLMGRLNEPEVAPLEEHLLICEDCRNRLEETETCFAAMRAVLKRQEQGRKSSGAAVSSGLLRASERQGAPGA